MGGMMWVDGGGAAAMEKARVVLDNERGRFESEVKADGTFAFSRVRPARFDIFVTPPPGAYVKMIQIGKSALTTPEFDGAHPGGALGIVLGTDGARLRGVVVDETGAPVDTASVVVIPDGPKQGWKTLVRTADSAKDGKFEVRDLAPGDYRALAFADAEDGAPADAEFRRPFEPRAVKIRVEPNASATVRLEAVTAAMGKL
jgi:hypothetical protein